jgi:hypothetical protein
VSAVVVTSKGRDVATARFIGATPTQAEPKVIAWGTGNAADTIASVSDIGLFSESAEARVTGTSSQVTTTTTSDTYQVTGSITASGVRSITEVGLFDSTTKPFSTTWSVVPTTTAGTTGTLAAAYTPANGTLIQSGTEVMTVTAGTGTTSVTVTRGTNGSTAIAQTNGWAATTGNAPGSSATVGGTCFVHGDFTAVALNTSDSIAFTIQVKVS